LFARTIINCWKLELQVGTGFQQHKAHHTSSRSVHQFSAKYIRHLDGGRTERRDYYCLLSSTLYKKHPAAVRYFTGLILSIYIERRIRDSVDSLPTSYGLDGPGFKLRQE
jgi:hypothetical protein